MSMSSGTSGLHLRYRLVGQHRYAMFGRKDCAEDT